MPTKIKIVFAILLVSITFSISGFSQEVASVDPATIPASAPSSADVIRQRVAKAKAYIAVKNFSAAIYELENIKRETSDSTLDSVINVLLMNSYLEQNNYKRAEAFLAELSNAQKSGNASAAQSYFAVAAQVIRGAKTQLERYHSLGLNVADRNLPTEAAVDIENMRKMLELIVEQSKDLGKNSQNIDTAMALLEGATNARGNLAKDDYDANRWRTEVTDAREMLASSRSTVIDATKPQIAEKEEKIDEKEIQKPEADVVAKNTSNDADLSLKPVTNRNSSNPVQTEKPIQNKTPKPAEENIAKKEDKKPEPIATNEEDSKKIDETDSAENQTPANRKRVVIGSAPKNEPTETESIAETKIEVSNNLPLEVGSLAQYATKKTNPIYPTLARSMRMTGVVKVEVIVDEEGKVTEVQKTDGPSLLQRAAKDAIIKWKFKPFERDGQPVKAVGFVSFNFSL